MVWVSATNSRRVLLQILQKFRLRIIQPGRLNLGWDLPNLGPRPQFGYLKNTAAIKTCMGLTNISMGAARLAQMQDFKKRGAAACA